VTAAARSATLEKTLAHIGEYLEQDVGHLTPESRLDNAVPGLDSLKLFEMMLYLEECFSIDFEEGLIERLHTIGDLASYIEGRVAAKEGGG